MQQISEIRLRKEEIMDLNHYEKNSKNSILLEAVSKGRSPEHFNVWIDDQLFGVFRVKMSEKVENKPNEFQFQNQDVFIIILQIHFQHKLKSQLNMDTKSNFSVCQSKFDDVFNFVELIIEKISDPNAFSMMVKDAASRYKLQKYKASKITLREFKLLISRKNIEHKKACHEDKWHKKELLAFIWFIVALAYTQQTSIEDLSQEKWEIISSIFNGKSTNFLEYEARCLEKSNKKFKKWEAQESEILANLIKIKNGKWKEISKILFLKSNKRFFRTSKQCREHWINYLDDSKQKNAWEIEEEIKLLMYVEIFGKKWAQISKIVKNRTQHSIKNQFRLIMKKFCRNFEHDDDQLQHAIRQICYLENIDQEELMQRVTNSIEGEQLTSNEKQSQTDRKIRCQQDELSEFQQIENLIFSYQENKFKQKQLENMWMDLVQEDLRQQLINDQKVICFEFRKNNQQAIIKKEAKIQF